MGVSIIAAIGINNELGAQNDLLWHLPTDFKWFISHTKGKPVIMGRKTMLSLGKPLKGRLNIVVTRGKFNVDGFIFFNSIKEAIKYAQLENDEIMIIGGAEIYKQTIDLADKLIITRVHGAFEHADVFFPEISNCWELQSQVSHGVDENHAYAFDFQIFIKCD